MEALQVQMPLVVDRFMDNVPTCAKAVQSRSVKRFFHNNGFAKMPGQACLHPELLHQSFKQALRAYQRWLRALGGTAKLSKAAPY